jgi:3-hydroxyacyl-CoA dehydrogenase
MDDREIRDRCIYALVNEAARVLAEGLAVRASDIDVIYVNGYGFPAYRGGPLGYADRVGVPHVLARIREFHAQLGDQWTPAPLLAQLAASGGSFASYDEAATTSGE